MADDNKIENIANQNANPPQQIERLKNELTTLNTQYEQISMELRSQKQTNEDNIYELQTLQTKYDSIVNENTNTMDDILIHQQNVDELHTLQLKYDELVEENNETMEAMSQLIIASNNKINNAKKEMEHKYKILYNEKQTLLKTVTQLTDEKQLISNKFQEAIIEIDELNQNMTDSNHNISMDSNKRISELESIISSKDKQCEELKHKMGILKEEYESLESKYEKLKKYKESFSKYKEKAKNVVNKHKNKAETQINAMKIQLDDINHKYKTLLQQHEKVTNNMNNINKQNETLNTQQITLSESITKVTAEKIKTAQKLDKYIKNLDIVKNKLKKYKLENEQLNQDITTKNERINELQQDIKCKDSQYEELKLNHKVSANDSQSKISRELIEINEKYNAIISEKKLLSNSVSLLSKQNESLRITNSQLQSWQNNINSNVMSLNNKISSKEDLIDKLSKHNTSLQYINDELDIKVKGMIDNEIQLKNKLDIQSKIKDKREGMLNKISGLLAQCSLFKNEKKILSLSVGVNKLIEKYENIMRKYLENENKYNKQKLLYDEVICKYNEKEKLYNKKQTDYNILMKQLAQKDEKAKKFAVKIKKLVTVRKELQIGVENMKNKLDKAVTDAELYQKVLTNIHLETKKTLEKWNVFKQKIVNNKQSNVLSDCRRLHIYFMEILTKLKDKKDEIKVDINEFEELKKDLIISGEEVISYKKELDESTKYINKLSKKLNHCIKCIKENWHYDIRKTDFSDLSVSTRLVLEDKIWCLIRWRKNKMEIKHNDEYFWCEQRMFLKKLNMNENEIYLPDLFENKFENQIINNLENKWKNIQRKTDNEIKELKVQKTQREDKLKQYKVILQKQKDKLMELKTQIKELNVYKDEVIKLRLQLVNVSNENVNYEEKYEQIENKLIIQRRDYQNKKLEFTEIENKLLLKEREVSKLVEKYDKQKVKTKKYYEEKLEDIKIKTREILEEKNKQILILENEMNVRKYDKEIQTEKEIYHDKIDDDLKDNKENDIDINNLNNNNNSQQMSIYNIINSPNTAERDAQIKGIHERLGRLQELLRESEEAHNLKDQELEYLKQIAMSTPQPEDNPDVNTQYLKNSLLQFFDEKINVKQLLSVATVGLRFDDDDLKKAQNSKLIANQKKSKSSWW